jgi:HK97 gp10 family phage protein
MADAFTLGGFDKLEAAFKQLGAVESRKRMSRVMRDATKIVLDQAVANAPEDTGLLKESLKVRAMKRKKGRVGFLVQTQSGDYQGKTFYGAFQEFGSSHQPAQGFIRQAYDERKSEAEQLILDQLWQTVVETAKGNADA